MAFVRKLFVVGFGFRLPVKIEVRFDYRGRRDEIFAGGNEQQWCARVITEVNRCRSLWNKVCEGGLQQHADWTWNDVTLESGPRFRFAQGVSIPAMKLCCG